MIIDECQEKMNCLYSLVNVSSVITDLSIFIAGGGGEEFWREQMVFRGNGGVIRYTYSTSNTNNFPSLFNVSSPVDQIRQ